MAARSSGNQLFKAARIAAGYASQDAFADAAGVNVRQVRRWESDNPPWPQPSVGQKIERLLGQGLRALGFTPPAGVADESSPRALPGALPVTASAVGLASVPTQVAGNLQPATAAIDFATITRAQRRLYWSVAPATLHPTIVEHSKLGCALLVDTAGQTRRSVAAALAETYLLAARIEFFDLRNDKATQTLVLALQAAAEADDPLMATAVLAHMAFPPAWSGHREEAIERMVAARTYARRGAAPALLMAWLDSVEAECETRCGNTRTALNLLNHAEDLLADGPQHAVPEWLDWFTPVRLAAFKGNTELKAGHLPQARATLLRVLEDLDPSEVKQASVILGDLGAVEAEAGHPEEACVYVLRALDQLERTWYAMGMDRVREVRRALAPHQHERCVRELDDRLYGWASTVSAFSG
ncbi:multiprotein-bridging factor 1 family protein [Streptomyces sp. NPDC088794]|uniref:helix-turn-helix domain-containing protein n=1 Tax=Streptomyces sp. NPDC088794 TaxID=3365902 RepID=UPI0038002B9E